MRIVKCAHCRKKRGLGAVSKAVYVPRYYWWVVVRFCSRACRDTFLRIKAEELARQKAVQLLFRPP